MNASETEYRAGYSATCCARLGELRLRTRTHRPPTIPADYSGAHHSANYRCL